MHKTARDGEAGTASELMERWKRAAITTRQADPFCTAPAWQLAFHEVQNPAWQLLVHAEDQSVMAFAAASDQFGQAVLLPLERLWMFGCPLLGKRAVGLLRFVVEAIRTTQALTFSKIVVSGVRPGGVLAGRLRSQFGATHDIHVQPTGTQCAASLRGGLDGYLSRRSANHRRNLKRERKKALDKGIRFERVLPDTAQETAEAYARVLGVELRSWKGMGGCGMESGFSRRFYERMLHRLAPEKGARIIFARHEDRDIGFVFGGLAGNIYRGQQFSYADDWKEYSVGNLLQMEQIAWLCEEGAARYDLGPITGEKMEYKRHWAEQRFPLEAWVLERK